MTTDLQKRNDQYTQRYETGDPYKAFADEGGPGIVGKLLRCRKGEWTVGDDPVKLGTQYLAIVPTSMRGWLRWQDGVVTDARMGLVADGFAVPHRLTLGEEEKFNTPDDPWGRCYRLLLIEMARPHNDVTFSSGSYGAERALKELCGTFAADRHLYPDAFPVVALGVRTRPTKEYGKIPEPVFPVTGWATIADVRAGKANKKKAKAKTAPAADFAKAIGDELTDWEK